MTNVVDSLSYKVGLVGDSKTKLLTQTQTDGKLNPDVGDKIDQYPEQTNKFSTIIVSSC